jgi:hypothetical protein
MALQKKASKSNKIVGWSLGVLIVVSVGYFGYTRLIDSKLNNKNSDPTGFGRPVITNYGQAILKDGRFLNLQDHAQNINADLSEAGQPEPFR